MPLVDSISLWLNPPRCLLCQAPGAAGRDLCRHCAADLPRLGLACHGCALPLDGAELCGRCQQTPPPQDWCWAALRYAPPLDHLLPALKFHADLRVARSLGRWLAERAPQLAEIDAVVPVPLHVQRLRERGFNQARELAAPLASARNWRLRDDWLHRRRPTPAQTGLNRNQRRANVRDSLEASPQVADRRILLFDDVMTTGATIEAAAAALKAAGADWVGAITLARAL